MEITPNILAIDSSTSCLKIGLSLSNGQVDHRVNNDRFRHAEHIFELIDQLLSANQVDKNRLKLIIVSIGPGSFTGLRVGMAAAKGIALALDLPLVGISTFQTINRKLFDPRQKKAVVIPSRRDEFYWGPLVPNEFDEKYISIISTAQLSEYSKEYHIYPVDFGIQNIEIDGTIIKSLNDSRFMECLIMAGINKFDDKGEDKPEILEPLYIQTFPAKPQ